MENIAKIKLRYGAYEARLAMKRNINSANLSEPRSPYHAKYHEIVAATLKEHGGKNVNALVALRNAVGLSCARRVMPKIGAAWTALKSKNWKPCVWDDETWFYTSKHYDLHTLHVSEDDATQVAFTPSEDYLLRDRQTRMKPGRYLAKYFGPESDNPVLTEAEVKYWADRQVAASRPAELRFIANDDPDGWEWVYENGPVSCMRYNRSDRYLASGLYGCDHPVRIYAHPQNDLALAFIMKDGCEPDRDTYAEYDEEVIAARCIVNVKDKTYHRLYAARDSDTYRSALRAALELAGYRHSNTVLDGQKLRLHRYGGNIVCPYLDGDYTNVEVYDDHLLVGSCGIDGQNSCGLIEDNRSVCDCCGDRVDDDELHYVEFDNQRVCSDCLDREYTYAYTGRYQEWVPDSENLYRHRGNTYTSEGLDYADLRVCEYCGEVVDYADCVELHDGDYVCADHAEECEVTGDWYLKDDMVDTEFDGRIGGDNAVTLFPSNEEGYEERCYRVSLPGDVFFVHQEFAQSEDFLETFGVFSQALIPFSLQEAYGGFIERITKAFVPLNVRDGNDVDSTIEDMIESHIEVEDELDLASPALITEETEHERIAA